MHPILEHSTKAQPRRYRLYRIDRTTAYRGWVFDQVPEGMQVFDYFAVSHDPGPQGEDGSQAAYVSTAWMRPGLPVSWNPNPLFIFDADEAQDCHAAATLLQSEVESHFRAYLGERTFRP